MKDIHQTYAIKAPVAKIWQALVDPKLIQQWSGEPAKMGAKPGEAFDLWNGSITGINITVLPLKKLTQDWRADDWPPDHFSEVVFSLSEMGGVTTLSLDQTGVPDDKADEIADGWKSYYLGAIQKLLESS